MAERLKEFLASITYQVDTASERRFDDSLEKGTKKVLAFGATLAAIAAGIGFATVKIADNFEKLYYSSQRTGASAQNIKGFAYAVSQLGGSTESALSSLEGVGSFIRSNPGALKFIESLGVSTTQNGKLRDTADIMSDIGDQLKQMSDNGHYAQAKQYASVLGIDEPTLLAMTRGLGDYRKQYAQLAKDAGVDYNRVSENSKDFMQQVRELLNVLVLLKDKVFSDLMERYGPALKQLIQDIIHHLPEISTRIENAVISLIHFGENLNNLINNFGGWKKVAEGVLLFFGTTWLVGMLAAIAPIAAALAPIIAAMAVGAGVAWSADKIGDSVTRQLAVGNADYAVANSSGDKVKAAFNFFRRQGWTTEQSAGIIANLQQESGKDLNENAIGDSGLARGIGQWHPDRQANFKKFAGVDIDNSTFAQQLAFKNYELTKGLEQRAGNLLRQTTTAHDAAGVESLWDFRPADRHNEFVNRSAMAEQLLRSGALGVTGGGSSGVQVTQTTKIDINGAGDPAAIGREVAGNQGRVNQDMTRNLKAVVR